MFVPGQRVRHRSTGDVGYIVKADPDGTYTVGFGDREWPVKAEFLEAVAAPVSDFARLREPLRGYPYEARLKRDAIRLTNAYRNDPLSVLSNSRVEPKPHQLSVLVRVIEKTRARMILADEVGLGKTIEAGLILKELRARGAAERVLILTPASLQTQWLFELRSKFNEDFQMYDGAYVRHLRDYRGDHNPFSVHNSVVCSLNLARSEPYREEIVASDWDLVIVDEAHHARNNWNSGEPRPNLAFELIEELRDRTNGLLLLTATPMQLHEFELFSLVSLVEPGLFADFGDFQTQRSYIREINEFVRALTDGPIGFPRQVQLLDLMKRLRAPKELLGVDLVRPSGREHIASWLEQQHLLAKAVVRNRKARVGGFVKREAHRVPVMPTNAELELERAVSAYISRRYEREKGKRSAVGLVLVTFQKLACSSSRALQHALINRRNRLAGSSETFDVDDADLDDELSAVLGAPAAQGEKQELDELIRLAGQVSDSKLDALCETLSALFAANPEEKVIVFTQFLQTLQMIREALDRLGLRVVTFSGRLDRGEKDNAVRQFREHAQVLVTSEAGGEGRNFQFCHIVFNYDLPWNPMRVEQRIGRLDRIGQQRNVLIYNFAVRGTLDERILDVLDHRIKIFTESVGALEPILGEIETDLQRLCLQNVEAAKAAVKKYEADLETRLHKARQAEFQARDLVMDMRSFRQEEVAELLGRMPTATREEIADLVSRYLSRFPHAGVTKESASTYRFRLPQTFMASHRNLLEEYFGTFDYRVALQNESLDFFAFGHPLVDSVISECLDATFAPSPGVLSSREVNGRSVVVDYMVELQGVHDETQLLSHLVRDRMIFPNSSTNEAAVGPHQQVRYGNWSSEEAEAAERASRQAADIATDAALASFQARNAQLLAEERVRLTKRFAFQRNSYQERIGRNQTLIDEAVAAGTVDNRSIGARRGYITRDKRRLEQLATEEARAFAELERKGEARVDLKLLVVDELVRAAEQN